MSIESLLLLFITTHDRVCARASERAVYVDIALHSIRFLGNTPLRNVFLFNLFLLSFRLFVVCWHATHHSLCVMIFIYILEIAQVYTAWANATEKPLKKIVLHTQTHTERERENGSRASFALAPGTAMKTELV